MKEDRLSASKEQNVLSIIDKYSWMSLSIQVDTLIPGTVVAKVLGRLFGERGKLQTIITNDGLKFVEKVLLYGFIPLPLPRRRSKHVDGGIMPGDLKALLAISLSMSFFKG